MPCDETPRLHGSLGHSGKDVVLLALGRVTIIAGLLVLLLVHYGQQTALGLNVEL